MSRFAERIFVNIMLMRRCSSTLLLLSLVIISVSCEKATPVVSNTIPSKDRSAAPAAVTLLNVSYDATRELYAEFNKEFAKHWQGQHHQQVTIEQSHGAAGAQARAVIDGLKADAVTFALPYDIEQVAQRTGKIPHDWQARFPNNSCPYSSTIVFLVRKGNPKGIRDWNDLVRNGIEVITPNPKTSGGARYNYLAAWGYALEHNNHDESKAREFVQKLFKHVPILDTSGRGATTTFVQRKIGDVLLAWENEALLALTELGTSDLELVVPSISIFAETPVAVVEGNASAHDASEVSQAYLEYLYSPVGQQIAARHHYRPSRPDLVDPQTAKQFPEVKMFRAKDLFGDWSDIHKKHFNDGGIFDQISTFK